MECPRPLKILKYLQAHIPSQSSVEEAAGGVTTSTSGGPSGFLSDMTHKKKKRSEGKKIYHKYNYVHQGRS